MRTDRKRRSWRPWVCSMEARKVRSASCVIGRTRMVTSLGIRAMGDGQKKPSPRKIFFRGDGFFCPSPIALIPSEVTIRVRPMTQEAERTFLASMEHTHGRQLRRFLSVRMRGAAADVPDLIQEIFLRLLRIKD